MSAEPMKVPHKISFWKRGGAPLWIAIGMHLLLGVVAMLCVWRIQAVPDPRVDFITPHGTSVVSNFKN